LSEVKMSSYNLPELDKIIKDCNVEVNIDTVKWSGEDEETSSSAGISMVIGLILSLVTYMFVLMYGAMIMSAVIEEKTNRIIEVIVSTCKPVELMLGKIIGVGLVGLTQILIWSVILGIIGVVMGFSFMPDMSDATMMSNQAALTSSDFGDIWNIITGINYAQILFFFVLYFIGGYLLYASLFAAFGSAVDQASDASQFTTPVMMIIIAGLYVGMACIENPNGQLAFWSSMIPFTSPIVMMIRLPFDTPVWEMILSLAILYGSVALIVYFSAKIYRTGILLYGKKNSVKDLFKWLKY
ncbi:MAG: ABC transporter permease, partial [Bacteroidales bacterium]|nr:ABC transporter permease [Bacteroidales bacterium]